MYTQLTDKSQNSFVQNSVMVIVGQILAMRKENDQQALFLPFHYYF